MKKKPKSIKAWTLVTKGKEKLDVRNLCLNKKDIVPLDGEYWVQVKVTAL